MLQAQLIVTQYVLGGVSELFARLRDDEEGQGSVEYLGVVIAGALIVLAIVGAASGWGGRIVTAIGEQIENIIP